MKLHLLSTEFSLLLFCALSISDSLGDRNGEVDVEKKAKVTIEKEEYSLVKAPSVVSREVQKHLGDLQHQNIQEIVQRATEAAQLLNITYYAVMALGPHYTDTQIKVQDIGFSMSSLLMNLRVSLHKVGLTSESIVDSLVYAHSYMLEGLPQLGLSSMNEISEGVKSVSPTWIRLLKQIEDIEKKIKEVFDSLKRQEGQQGRKRETLEEEQEKLEKDLNTRERELRDAQNEEWKQEEEARRLKDLEEDAIDGIKLHPVLRTVNFLTNIFFRTSAVDSAESASKSQADRYGKKRKEAEEAVKRRRKMKEENRRQMEEDLWKMSQNAKMLNGSTIEDVLNSIHWTIEQLGQIHEPIKEVIEFLNKTENFVSGLKDKKIVERFELLAQKEDGQHIEKAIQSTTYKREAVKYYAFWVALGNFSRQFDSKLKETKESLHEILKENPTWEAARRELNEMIRKKQEKITDKSESERKSNEGKRHSTKTEL